MPRKIIITSNTLEFGGAERQRVGLANGLVQRGWPVEIRVLQRSGALEPFLNSRVNLRLHNARWLPSAMAALTTRNSMVITGTTLTEVAHGFLASFWPLNNWWVVAAHNPTKAGSKTYSALPRILMSFARRFITLSQVQTDSLVSNDGFALKRVRIIPNGIETKPYSNITKTQACEPLVRFGFIGRLSKQKGLDLLLDALKACQDVSWSLIVSGDGPESALAQDLRFEAIANRVHWVGGRDSSETFAEIDVLIVPSRNEAFPLILLEAMAAGIPLLTTDVGANAQIIEGRQGRIIRDTSAWAFSQDLRSAARDLRELSLTADLARAAAVEDFSLSKMIDKYENVLRERVRT